LIIAQTPLRVSLVGGGSDLRAFYSAGFGAVISATIDRSVYVGLSRSPCLTGVLVRHAAVEWADNAARVAHPLVRECLRLAGAEAPLDITCFGDVPPGSGLGSSSALCVGLLQVLQVAKGEPATSELLARMACTVEIDLLEAPIGKQDQYAASYGGLNYIRFNADESVDVDPLRCPDGFVEELEKMLMLFHLGRRESSSTILVEQRRNVTVASTRSRLEQAVELATELRKRLEGGNLDEVGAILDEGWRLKRAYARGISNELIEHHYATARRAGARGGKVLGAGGGGFLLLCCEPDRQAAVRTALASLTQQPFRFVRVGSRVICDDTGALPCA
jgi:D-glycero-alpha-D-manno-heptose-7-phosphate kinase